MKNRLLYGLIFLIAFFVVTGLLIIANENFENIFTFDFSEKKRFLENFAETENQEELIEAALSENIEIEEVGKDTTQAKDSLLTVEISTDTAKLSEELIKIPQLSELKNEPKVKSTKQEEAKKDSSYLKWKRETVKLYEAMDSKKVAKLISNLSDDTARDLIYSMKKRKAAEVLSNLSPEIAIRLTRAR